MTRELTIGSRDEIGQVARSFNVFMNKLRSMMFAVKNNETKDAMGDTEEAVREISETAGGARSLSQDVFDQAKENAQSALATGRRADTVREGSTDRTRDR